jgi:hypothetical protein
MSVTGINYEEGSKKKDLGYESVSVAYDNVKKEKMFDSGDFVKDWYDATKFTLHLEGELYHSNSSSVDHFIMDGALFDSMYLGFDEENKTGVLSTQYGDGVELFVKKGTTPTWEELREICGDKKIK